MPLLAIEPYTVFQEDGDVTQADTTADIFGDLFKYRAPKGRALVLRPGDPFSCKMYDTGEAECSVTDRIKLVKRDQEAGEEVPITGEILYGTLKESQDEDKMFRLPTTHEIEIGEQEYLVLMIYSGDTGGDKDKSWFDLVCRSKRIGA